MESHHLYPRLELSSFKVERSALPEGMRVPCDVDKILSQPLPDLPGLNAEVEAVDRWERRREKLEEERGQRGQQGGASVSESGSSSGSAAAAAALSASLEGEEERLRNELRRASPSRSGDSGGHGAHASSLSTSEMNLVRQFRSITATDEARAVSILHSNNWVLETSVQYYFDNPT